MKEQTLQSLKPKLRPVKDEDLEQIGDEDIAGVLGDDSWVHEGDLVIEGDLSVTEGALLVLGDLTVSGEVTTDETGTLAVMGQLKAHHLYLEGNLEVHGDATLSGVVYGFYEAGISRVYGKTTAKLGLIGNHDWSCDSEHYEVSGRFSNFHKLMEGDPEAIRKLVGDKEFAQLARMLGVTKEEAEGSSNSAWGLSLFHRV
ncbi:MULTISPECIES: hypothetical protein [unclassified Myxococcus]|uniref:hypothetical protein n=1 Tax=unclassified Myxococcus TaxID=2648731 RepID=UPI00157A3A3F|nr:MULTISPECIES: hypothetical protein [unclassified Myxococcus]NTX40424.1 hypothetical protein [Myxococcus sp. CA033]NTX51507.1 hypothetical protein [Myxococcus sp. CA039A]